MKISIILAFLFVTCLYGVQETTHSPTNANPQARLGDACKTLLAEPLSQDGLQVLLDYSRSTSGIPQLKSRSMAVYALSALAKGDTNLFDRAQRSHAANFSADRGLVKVGLAACYRPCATCGGAGYIDREVTCSTCKGAGKCVSCNGTGKWQTESAIDTRVSRQRKQSSVMACAKCDGTCRCPDCNGSTVSRHPCDTCKGVGSFFERPRALSENYQSLLSDMVAMIQGEESVAERIRQAMAETDINSRIRAFEKLLSEFHQRPEMHDIERLLLADKNVLKEDEKKRCEKARQIGNELSALRALSFSENTKASIITLREYLALNPDSPHKLEIQGLLNTCIMRLENKRARTRWIYIIGGLLSVLFGLSCIHINYYKYTLLPSYTTAAKRRKPDANQFTDPLSLTAEESKARGRSGPENSTSDQD